MKNTVTGYKIHQNFSSSNIAIESKIHDIETKIPATGGIGSYALRSQPCKRPFSYYDYSDDLQVKNVSVDTETKELCFEIKHDDEPEFKKHKESYLIMLDIDLQNFFTCTEYKTYCDKCGKCFKTNAKSNPHITKKCIEGEIVTLYSFFRES